MSGIISVRQHDAVQGRSPLGDYGPLPRNDKCASQQLNRNADEPVRLRGSSTRIAVEEYNERVGERLKKYQKAWSTPRLRTIGHSLHWGPYGRFLPCCREQLAKMTVHMHDLRREAGSRLLERGADLHIVQVSFDRANSSTSNRYLKPSKLALHTTIQRIDAQRRESGAAETMGATARGNAEKLAGGTTKRPQIGKIDRTTTVGKDRNRNRVPRLGA